ncbi:MAG TPA: hypothetical protein VFP10_02265 [Candidatus Eisenbacteria bacterium]|nr:hypothetical protein [Candidatus Eisenbacteria bacterium]
MSKDERHPYTTLEMELVGIVGNDYESLETIRKFAWDADIPLPSVGEMIESLRALQAKGWVQCYRFVVDGSQFVPIDGFQDSEAEDPIQLTGQATLWWLATASGLSALKEELSKQDPDVNDVDRKT